MQKIIIIVFFICETLASCTDRYKALEALNEAPKIVFTSSTAGVGEYTELTDTVKLFPNNFYNLPISISDTNSNIQRFEYDCVPAFTQHLFVNNLEYTKSLPTYNSELTANIKCNAKGRYVYYFILTDRFNRQAVATLNLDCIANLAPISRFTVEEVKQNDPLEYLLNGATSTDGDYRFGGRIKNYTYIINNTDSINSNASKIRYIFPQQGLFKVELRVTDNENAVGTSTQFVNIN